MGERDAFFGNPQCSRCLGFHPVGFDCALASRQAMEKTLNTPVQRAADLKRKLIEVVEPGTVEEKVMETLEQKEQQAMSLRTAFQERHETNKAIIDALAHMPRERALHIVLSWFSIQDLRDAAPTLIGGDPAPQRQKAHDFILRLKEAADRRNLLVAIEFKQPRAGGGSQSRSISELWIEALLEAID